MRVKSKKIALASMYAASYVAITEVLGPISYQQFNFRISDSLLGLVPLLGWPGIVGHTIGVFISNINSPLGPIDLLNTIPSFLCSYLIWRLRSVSVLLGLVIYSLVISTTVSLAISFVFNQPFLIIFASVSVGIFTVCVGAGYLIYRSLLGSGVERYIGE